MTKKAQRSICIILAICSGCNQNVEPEQKIGPEVGLWHAELELSDLSDSMSDEDRLLLTVVAGNIMFEVDAEFCEDGTFSYVMNTDKLEDAVSDTVSTVFGFFFDFDISLFVERLVEAALQDTVLGTKQDYTGTYTKSESNLITATDEANLYFKIKGNRLIQIDSEGNEILRFSRVS